MDTLFVFDGLAVTSLIIARIIERKELLVFSGVLFLLVGLQILLDNNLQYLQSNSINITSVNDDVSISQSPIYNQFEILSTNAAIVVALGQFAFGLIIMLKSVGQ